MYTYIYLYIRIYIYMYTCELNNLGCTNHTPTAGCLGNHRLRHRHCAWLKARRCKSEDAAAVGSQVSRSVTSSYWTQGVTVKSPVRGFPFLG